MKLYHGSPKKLKVLYPYQARGINEFQNQKAIFLTKSFDQAALYSLAKSLKEKTPFALPPGKIIIVGNLKPVEKGYVYEIDLQNNEVKKGEFGNYEYAYLKPIRKFKIHIINIRKYKDKIKNVKSKKELFNLVK